MKRCCNGYCQQGRACPARHSIRWPVLCTRCGSTSHYAEDCTRIPALGMSQQERDHLAGARADRNVVLLAGLAVVLALVLFGLLERVPS